MASRPSATIKVSGKSGISQARTRLGWEPVRRLHDELVKPIAVRSTRGAWYRHWRLVSLDGSTLDIADDPANDEAFGRPGSSRGRSAFPQIRFVALVENGTHVLFGTRMARYDTGENTLAKGVLPSLQPGMLCLADRQFFCFSMWNLARQTGADLLWRVKTNALLPRETEFPDGSYLSHIYPSEKDRRHKTNGVQVRVIEYCLEGVAGAEPIYRLVATILDPDQAPAEELAALYHERWEIETALAELRTHLRGAKIVLRSKTPDFGSPGILRLHNGALRHSRTDATKPPSKPTRTPTNFLSSIRSASSVASSRASRQFPPRQRCIFHEAVLDEILERDWSPPVAADAIRAASNAR